MCGQAYGDPTHFAERISNASEVAGDVGRVRRVAAALRAQMEQLQPILDNLGAVEGARHLNGVVQVSDNGDLEVNVVLALVNDLYGANGQLDPVHYNEECQVSALDGESWTDFAARLDACNEDIQNTRGFIAATGGHYYVFRRICIAGVLRWCVLDSVGIRHLDTHGYVDNDSFDNGQDGLPQPQPQPQPHDVVSDDCTPSQECVSNLGAQLAAAADGTPLAEQASLHSSGNSQRTPSMALGKQVEFFRTRFGLDGSMEAVLDQTADLLDLSENFRERTDQGVACMEALDRRDSASPPCGCAGADNVHEEDLLHEQHCRLAAVNARTPLGRPSTASSTGCPPSRAASSCGPSSIPLPEARKQPVKHEGSGATRRRQQKHGRILEDSEIKSDDSSAVLVDDSEYASGSGSDGDDFQKQSTVAQAKKEKRNTKRAACVAAAKALEPGTGNDEAYKIPPTQVGACIIEFILGETSFNTMAEVQNNVFAVAEAQNRTVVASGRLVEVMLEADADEHMEDEEEEEGGSGSKNGAKQLVWVPKKPKG